MTVMFLKNSNKYPCLVKFKQIMRNPKMEKWTVNSMAVDKNRKSNFYPLSLAWLFSDFGFFNVETHKKFLYVSSC